MNIKALRAFRATLAEGSLAKASETLNLSQPAVSRLVSALEAELRLTLFDRTGRHLTPTQEGLAFFREAGRILASLDQIPNIAADIRAGRTESLRIVTMPRIAQALTAPVVAHFMRCHPISRSAWTSVRAAKPIAGWPGANTTLASAHCRCATPRSTRHP
jgi:DNA-binding transcriptional LysR family regulator